MLFPETLKDMNSFSQFQKNPNKQINKQTKKKENNNNNNNNNKTTTEKPAIGFAKTVHAGYEKIMFKIPNF